MYARITTFLGAPGRLDADLADVEANVLPELEGIDGFQRLLILNDRASGRSIAITIWESEERLRASEAQATRLRHDNPVGTDSTVLSVERCEVALDSGRG